MTDELIFLISHFTGWLFRIGWVYIHTKFCLQYSEGHDVFPTWAGCHKITGNREKFWRFLGEISETRFQKTFFATEHRGKWLLPNSKIIREKWDHFRKTLKCYRQTGRWCWNNRCVSVWLSRWYKNCERSLLPRFSVKDQTNEQPHWLVCCIVHVSLLTFFSQVIKTNQLSFPNNIHFVTLIGMGVF